MTGQDDIAVKVLTLLKSARLARDDEALQKAADLAKVATPMSLSEITPRFEASSR